MEGTILDAMLTTDRTIDLMLRSNKAGVLCKLDIEKAYEDVN